MPSYLQIWVDEGDWDRAARFAFVELEPAAAAAIPASCIRSVFLSVAPALPFRLHPSPRGVALMEFDSESEREAAMAVQPVHHRGDVVKLQRVEDTTIASSASWPGSPTSSCGTSLRSTGPNRKFARSSPAWGM